MQSDIRVLNSKKRFLDEFSVLENKPLISFYELR